jgi:hypothetical protein
MNCEDAPQAPFLRWGEFRERSRDIPSRFAPSSKGLFLPSDELLRFAGYIPGSRHPGRWVREQKLRRRLFINQSCKVYGLGKWWVIERSGGTHTTPQVLVFSLGSWLIVTPTYLAAIRLAECCSPHVPDALGLLCWEEKR